VCPGKPCKLINILAELHGWNSKTKALCLASNFSGGARALLNEMSDYDSHNYDSLGSLISDSGMASIK
jgi:hypothetical protein